jgi:hypothetical protein
MTLLADALAVAAAQRLHWWRDDRWYGRRYTVDPAPADPAAGRADRHRVTVRNTGVLVWPHQGADAVHLSYHWESTTRRARTCTSRVAARRCPTTSRPAPASPWWAGWSAREARGSYQLRWDLVRESVTWFSERGIATADQTVEWSAERAARQAARAGSPMLSSTLEDVGGDRAPQPARAVAGGGPAVPQHPLLGVGPDNFRRRYPEVIAPKRRDAYDDERIHANSFYSRPWPTGPGGPGRAGLPDGGARPRGAGPRGGRRLPRWPAGSRPGSSSCTGCSTTSSSSPRSTALLAGAGSHRQR